MRFLPPRIQSPCSTGTGISCHVSVSTASGPYKELAAWLREARCCGPQLFVQAFQSRRHWTNTGLPGNTANFQLLSGYQGNSPRKLTEGQVLTQKEKGCMKHFTTCSFQLSTDSEARQWPSVGLGWPRRVMYQHLLEVSTFLWLIPVPVLVSVRP